MEFLSEFINVFKNDYIDDEILITDSNACVIAVTPSCKKLYGVDPHEVLGKTIQEIELSGVHSPSATPVVLEQRKSITVIQETRSKHRIIVTSTPIFNDWEEISRVVSFCKDVTNISFTKNWKAIPGHIRSDTITEAHSEVIVSSREMEKIFNIAKTVSNIDCNILIEGETGTGKEVIAKEIYKNSERNKEPFVHVNCSAIPENLLESELFGYEPGAFTGASKTGKIGMFEVAKGGYIFLDEVGEMPLLLQAKLLNVIQTKTIFRLGGTKPIDVKCRVIAATNRNLEACIQEGTFREDLFYRLGVVRLKVPPLRERRDDIIPLVDYYLCLYNVKYNKEIKINSAAYNYLSTYHWCGNVRELSNVIERLVIFSENKNINQEEMINHINEFSLNPRPSAVSLNSIMPLKEATEDLERKLLTMARQAYQTTPKIATALKIDQATVYRKLKKYNLL